MNCQKRVETLFSISVLSLFLRAGTTTALLRSHEKTELNGKLLKS